MANLIRKQFSDDKQYHSYKRRKAALPKTYQEMLTALITYMEKFAKSGAFTAVLNDLLDIFEEGADATVSVTEIVGEDPINFAETIMRQHPEEVWLSDQRTQLLTAYRHIVESV